MRALGRTLSGILVLATLLLGWFVYRVYYANPRTDDAYVQANTASLAAHVSGQIIQLPIKDNQQVKKGDLLFVVDPRPYKLALDTAQTKLNLTEIEIKTLQDTINSRRARSWPSARSRRRTPNNIWTASCHYRSATLSPRTTSSRRATSSRQRRPALPPRLPSFRKHKMRWESWAT